MLKESLKQKLNRLIEQRGGGVFTLREVYQVCDEFHYKYDNATRRLRHSESPSVAPVFNNGAIVGYRWIGTTDKVAAFLRDFPSKEKKLEGVLF